ncbi:MAG: MBL fold metallo-hydrolase [Pseudomonadota bacterium]
MLRTALALIACVLASAPSQAQDLPGEVPVVSQCLALARDMPLPRVQYASFTPASLERGEVSIRFVGHSTFRIESASGVVIATDFAGWAGNGRVPDIVTMNRAHSSHYTDNPDPEITHVLRGWGTDGNPFASHSLVVEDVLVRNVTTDIRQSWSFDGEVANRRPNDNSIFIFEIDGLCIGHLGHLHHALGPEHKAKIGRLDILMVPVDGRYTMNVDTMIDVIRDLRSSIVLPMHYFGPTTLQRFLTGMEVHFPVEIQQSPQIRVSLNSLPPSPKVIVLPGY